MQDQALNRYWKTVVDTIQDGVMVVDVNGTIVSANHALSQITGYDQTELIGQPCSVLNTAVAKPCLKARFVTGACCFDPVV